MSLNESMAQLDVGTRMTELWPVFMYLGIVSVLGVTGNILVIIIYGKRPSKTSSMYFIVWLAVLDLIACAVCLTFEFVELTLAFRLIPSVVYKLLRFGTHFTTSTSLWTLIFIAFDRCYNVYMYTPVKQQTTKRNRILIAFAIFLGLIFSWPAGVIHGNTTHMIYSNSTHSPCSRYTNAIEVDHINPGIYYYVIGITMIICMVLIIVPYSCILIHVCKHVRSMRKIPSLNRHNIITERLTGIFVAITVVYAITCAPTIAVFVIVYYYQRCVEYFNPYKVNITIEFLLRTYFINNVVNPFIYGIFNSTFRNECRSLLVNVKNCLWCGVCKRVCNGTVDKVASGACNQAYNDDANSKSNSASNGLYKGVYIGALNSAAKSNDANNDISNAVHNGGCNGLQPGVCNITSTDVYNGADNGVHTSTDVTNPVEYVTHL